MKIKKKYIYPEIQTFYIDREISLIMMTWTDEGNPPPPGGPGSPNQAPSQFEQSNFKDNPFEEK